MTQFDRAEDRERELTPRPSTTYVVRPGETVGDSGAHEHEAQAYRGDRQDDQDASPDDPEQIRVEIEETRVELTATVDAIQEKLNPSVLMEQAKEHAQEAVHDATQQAKDAVREATVGRAEHMMSNATERASGVGSTIMDTIRENPVPAALAGISLGWLFMKRSHRNGYNPPVAAHSGGHYWAGNANSGTMSSSNGGTMSTSNGGIGHVAGQVQDRAGHMVGQVQDRASDMAGQVQDRASEVVGQVQERASDMADHVTDTAGHLAETAQQRARRVQGRVGDLLEDSPLLAGALAMTVGAAIGLAAPSTEQEHELFGEHRDNLMRQMRGTAREMGHKVQRVAEQTQDAALKAADEQMLTAS